MNKYELIPCIYNSISNYAKYQIRALRDIGDKVRKGNLGGFVENENSLSQ